MAPTQDRLWQTAEALERGRELYAAGRFFEAHEAWQGAWREESGALRRLLQGLILATGAYHKMAVQRQPRGMTRLLAMALDRLQPIPDGFAGLRLDQFRAGLVQSREEAFAWYSGGPAPSGPAPLGTYLTAPWRPSVAG